MEAAGSRYIGTYLATQISDKTVIFKNQQESPPEHKRVSVGMIKFVGTHKQKTAFIGKAKPKFLPIHTKKSFWGV